MLKIKCNNETIKIISNNAIKNSCLIYVFLQKINELNYNIKKVGVKNDVDKEKTFMGTNR